MRVAARGPALLLAAIAAPLDAAQSVHDPASAAAGTVHALGIALYAGAGVVTVLVLGLVVYAVARPARPISPRLFVLGGGIVFPLVVLTVLLVAALLIGNVLSRPLDAPVARVQVIAHQWWWEVRYLPPTRVDSQLAALLQQICSAQGVRTSAKAPDAAADAVRAVVLANEIRIPVGHAVELELHTRDVIHSLWVPALGGKVDMIPGRVNRIVWQAQRPGVFRGQCAEYCGGPHGLMGLVVVAEDPADYRAWLERQAADARRPAGAEHARGQKAFLQSRCVECHTIRGTPASGREGPDLTHVGSRRTLAAATLDNHVGTLAGWIADPQSAKPGNRMPPSTGLDGAELRALAAYLASLD